jgi:acetyl-CoA carboxylase biotin carboxylase subunit
MGSLVVDAAKAVQYTNAGTFEFLMDAEGKFYYMETNTRLQVEHPVTEMITGHRHRQGADPRSPPAMRLGFKQSDITFTGHSIECRVNAEDPETFTAVARRHPRLQPAGGPWRPRRLVLPTAECTVVAVLTTPIDRQDHSSSAAIAREGDCPHIGRDAGDDGDQRASPQLGGRCAH